MSDALEAKVLGTTILSRGGRTTVPKEVMEILHLRFDPQRREKLLWTQKGDEVTVSRGTPESSFRKSILSEGGIAAVPKHIREALKLESTPQREDRVVWIRKGQDIIVRKATPIRV
jgi:bifunctional DNA-binding transcriptional regulator/antitoxin component of YhaV-PrlF toxin-antitoxin module